MQDFLDANAEAVTPLGQSEGRRQLDAAITRLDTLSRGQGSARLQMAGQISRKRALAAELITRHVQPIAVFARARLRGVADFAALIHRVGNLQRRRRPPAHQSRRRSRSRPE